MKNYKFSNRGLSDAQLNFIVSKVLDDLKEEDLAIEDEQAKICDPVQAISNRTGLR